ncbi:MAG: anthranilate phosphoribosyltransferase, partial [Steroidobacteraceae bacterium]
MSAARDLLDRLLERRNLTQPEAEELLGVLADPATSAAFAGAVLAAIRSKGAVADEVRGFAQAMRRLARRPSIPAGLPAIDVVGTGGDCSGSLNISTGTALLTAACGVPVVKHGNRSISSRAGSADVLEALGLALPLDEEMAGKCLAACNFTFLFAPYYHPATKAVAVVRAALGVRTIFNILGPLTNPAEPPFHVIGAFSLEVAELIAHTLAGMPLERAFVLHGARGWDEPTPIGPFTVFDVRPGHTQQHTRTPEEYGLRRCEPARLAGGDAQHNARALRAVLEGEDRGPHRDCLLLGAALALEVAGKASR